MKRFLLLASCLLSCLLTFAQPGPEVEAYLRAFPQRAAFNTHAYEFLPLHDTPAPKGYKPFYISHYGRHGSRTDGTGKAMFSLDSLLSIAATEGILTPAGDSLLGYAKRITAVHGRMEGRLTDRGAREHTRLAERMFHRYPQVFKSGGAVYALSSIVPRCLVSMSAFTSSLKACKKDIEIHWDCGEVYQKFITRSYSREMKERSHKLAWEVGPVVPYDTLALYSRIFTDPERGRRLFGKAKRLASYIYSTAAFAEAFDVNDNLFRFLPWDYVTNRSSHSALSAYLGHCNSVEFGDERIPRAGRLAGEMIRRADEAIAGAPVAANLIFGHDWPFLGICSIFGLEGYGYPRMSAEEALYNWNGPLHCPFAANLQIIFYRNRKGGDILVKFLTNERETPIPELTPVSGPYYRWNDVKEYVAHRQ